MKTIAAVVHMAHVGMLCCEFLIRTTAHKQLLKHTSNRVAVTSQEPPNPQTQHGFKHQHPATTDACTHLSADACTPVSTDACTPVSAHKQDATKAIKVTAAAVTLCQTSSEKGALAYWQAHCSALGHSLWQHTQWNAGQLAGNPAQCVVASV